MRVRLLLVLHTGVSATAVIVDDETCVCGVQAIPEPVILVVPSAYVVLRNALFIAAKVPDVVSAGDKKLPIYLKVKGAKLIMILSRFVCI